jgi:hypothetical protein
MISGSCSGWVSRSHISGNVVSTDVPYFSGGAGIGLEGLKSSGWQGSRSRLASSPLAVPIECCMKSLP